MWSGSGCRRMLRLEVPSRRPIEEIYRFCQRRHEIRCETVDETRQMIGCSDSGRLQKAKKPKLFLRSFIHVCFDTFCDIDFLLPLKNTGMFTLKRRIYFTCRHMHYTPGLCRLLDNCHSKNVIEQFSGPAAENPS